MKNTTTNNLSKSELFFMKNPELKKFSKGNQYMLDKLFIINRISVTKKGLECWSDIYNGYIRVINANTVITWKYSEKGLIKIEKDIYKV